MNIESFDGEHTGVKLMAASCDRARVETMLSSRYGIDSAFVRVETLAKVLGLAPSTIHTQMKAGRFCMPFRRISSIPVVKVDDLIAWYCDDNTVIPMCSANAGNEEEEHECDVGGETAKAAPSDNDISHSKDLMSNFLVEHAMAKMRTGKHKWGK